MDIQSAATEIINREEYNKERVRSNPEILEQLANSLLQSEVFLVESEIRRVSTI